MTFFLINCILKLSNHNNWEGGGTGTMIDKKTIMKDIKNALDDASSKTKSPDLSTFCINMLKADEAIDKLSNEYDDEKNTKSITQRYFNFSDNNEFPLQRFNGIVMFCKAPKNKQGIFGKLFKEATITKISKLVEKALKNFDFIMDKIGGPSIWERIIKCSNETKPISSKTAAMIYNEIVESRNKDGEIKTVDSDTARTKESEWLPPICRFFGYTDDYSGAEYRNIVENVEYFYSRDK